MLESLFPILLLGLMVLLLFVLPARQRKKMQEKAQAMQESLTVGTPVMTTSGIHATVAALGEKTVDLEIAPGVVVTVARPAILEIRKPAGPGDVTLDKNDGTPGGHPGDGTV